MTETILTVKVRMRVVAGIKKGGGVAAGIDIVGGVVVGTGIVGGVAAGIGGVVVKGTGEGVVEIAAEAGIYTSPYSGASINGPSQKRTLTNAQIDAKQPPR